MTETKSYVNINPCTTVLSADQQPKEEIMLDQQKITIIYCRLSVEDIKEDTKDGKGNSKADESNSIQNQKELLLRYAKDHGYTNTKVLIDDGYTGTNFDRPGVQEGFELVKQGLVGCWLVKDMSRLGRDYLTVGQYTDIIFPSYDVRFIAVADGVDSAHGDNEGFTAIRNLFNEWYPRDTSKKVRAVFRQKGTSGKHLGQAPFGYIEDPNTPGYWLIDEEAAKVVRHIFALCIDGNQPSRIARMLEKEQVLTVKAYYAMKKGKPLPEYPYRWNDNSVVGILERIEYTGCTCNFKTYSKSFKLKKRLPNAPENMYILEDTQEAIITKVQWDRVQELRKNKRRPAKAERQGLFSGLLFCADCGNKLHFATCKSFEGKQDHYVCSSYISLIINSNINSTTICVCKSNDFLQNDFLCACFDVIHLSSPLECIVNLQRFVCASFFGKMRNYVIEQRVSLQINIVEIFIESSFGEKGGVCSATVLFHKVKAQIRILVKRIISLFGKCKVRITYSVTFCISNVFHNKYPFF